jgi:hypothetical protein
MDIEGAERYLFADDETTFQTLRDTKFIAVEIHDEFRVRPRIYKYLDKFGLNYFGGGE